ncbi:S8/S53 family peptidase [Pseudoalteromonas sp. SMS1]|uniref:S8 family peptidase n=1 Tax=Pseudoalteromonas sp. SMS1 TaxID=2908894 RepID=UPI001F47892B|nr:S8/S53 family peptidase [Pseudoalteromonas sp. SMS1]MCF2858291.1 S8/S53 family peptidase [Pseudoalteromonas sp. SMS1]
MLLSLGVVAQDNSHVPFITFKNHTQSIELFPSNQSNIYDSNIGFQFYLNGKIIVQTPKNQKHVLDSLKKMGKVQVLAQLKDSQVVLISKFSDSFSKSYSLIESLPHIMAVQPDFAIVRTTTKPFKHDAQNTPKLNIARLKTTQCEIKSTAKRIAVIDDGFDLSKPHLSVFKVLLEYDADRQQAAINDQSNVRRHGNMVAGVIANQLLSKYGPNTQTVAELIAIRQASTLNSAMILAFSVSQKMNVDVINSSWTLPFVSQLLRNVIRDGLTHGGVSYVVVSAGNHGKDACAANKLSEIEGVTTVGALSHDGSIAAYSNYGRCVDVYAPANFSSQKTSTHIVQSGTSSAAAMVTGEISYLLGCGLSSSEIGLINKN